MTPAELRDARLTLGLTQAQIAPLLGYVGKRSAQTVSDMESGRVPVAESARLLIGAYLSGYRPEGWPE